MNETIYVPRLSQEKAAERLRKMGFLEPATKSKRGLTPFHKPVAWWVPDYMEKGNGNKRGANEIGIAKPMPKRNKPKALN